MERNTSEGRTIISDAALKLNFDKKVRFQEQLSFKLEQAPLFKSEEPMPIDFKNVSAKIGTAKKAKKGKKATQNKSKTF